MRSRRVYDPEFDRRVNEIWRVTQTLRLEIGDRAQDQLLTEWAEGRNTAEVVGLITSRLASRETGEGQ